MDKIKYFTHLVAFSTMGGIYVLGKIISNIFR